MGSLDRLEWLWWWAFCSCSILVLTFSWTGYQKKFQTCFAKRKLKILKILLLWWALSNATNNKWRPTHRFAQFCSSETKKLLTMMTYQMKPFLTANKCSLAVIGVFSFIQYILRQCTARVDFIILQRIIIPVKTQTKMYSEDWLEKKLQI